MKKSVLRLKKQKKNLSIVGVLFFLLLLFMFFQKFQQKNNFIFFRHGFYLNTDCEIRDQTGEIVRKFKYLQCLFFDDGTYIGTRMHEKKGGIDYIDQNGEVIWSLPLVTHHQMNFLEDKQSIVVTSFDIVKSKGKKIKFDSLFVISKKGKILHEWHLRDHWNFIEQKLQIQMKKFSKLPDVERRYEGYDFEASHLNSVHEIPETALSQLDPIYKKGNFLVNVFGRYRIILILSSDLKNILSVKSSPYVQHDMQILPNGKLISYINSESSDKRTLSWLELSDPITGSVEWTYKNPTFSSERWGSVQSIEQGKFWVFTEHDDSLPPQVKIIDNLGNLQWQFSLNTNGSKDRRNIFRALILNLERFLSLNKSG